MSEALIVAIDGPGGVGKSTAARRLAARLGIPYVDTGAMYRALALSSLRAGLAADDVEGITRLVERSEVTLDFDAEGTRTLLDGEDVGARIRTPQVTLRASVLATLGPVRDRLVALQRQAAAGGGVVEGRDIGSVVFPETPFKFFLDAPIRVRAQRRADELRRGGAAVDAGEVEEEMRRRDRRDRSRSHSPLVCDESYVRVDTGEADPDEVVERILAAIQAKREEIGARSTRSSGK